MARSHRFFGAAVVVAVTAAVVSVGSPAWAAHPEVAASSQVAAEPGDPPSLTQPEPAVPAHPLTPPVPAPSSTEAAPFSDPETSPGSAPDASSDSGVPADAEVGTVYGRVSSDYNQGMPTNGITVTLFQFASDGTVTFSQSDVTHQILTSDSIGSFAFNDIPFGQYWVLFSDPTDPDHPTAQWYGSTLGKPAGTPVDVSGPTGLSYNVVKTGDVTGTVTCVGCSAPLDPSTLSIIVALYDPSTNTADPVLTTHPEADGSYAWKSLQPGLYMTLAVYSGTGPYSKQSNSNAYQLATQATTTADVLVAHLIAPLDGVQPRYNSVVNALYFDFLNRLPATEEASGWANLLQNQRVPRGAVSEGFVTSDEYRLIRIDAAYQGILGRAPDAQGRSDWLENMKAGRITTDDIETSLYSSEEYFSAHGGTNSTFAASLYQTLLHRPGSQEEWDHWAALADQIGRDFVVRQFWNSPETIAQRVSLMYQTYLGRAPDAGGLQSWVDVALAIGDSGLRAGLTGSDEYFLRSQYRFQES